MIVSRSTLKDPKGEKLPEGAYILKISDKGRGTLIPISAEELKRIFSEILGAEA